MTRYIINNDLNFLDLKLWFRWVLILDSTIKVIRWDELNLELHSDWIAFELNCIWTELHCWADFEWTITTIDERWCWTGCFTTIRWNQNLKVMLTIDEWVTFQLKINHLLKDYHWVGTCIWWWRLVPLGLNYANAIAERNDWMVLNSARWNYLRCLLYIDYWIVIRIKHKLMNCHEWSDLSQWIKLLQNCYSELE